MNKAVAILDTFATVNGTVTEVTFNMAGGSSHEEREAVAREALEAFTARSGRPVAGPMSYEVRRFGRDLDFKFFVATPQQTP